METKELNNCKIEFYSEEESLNLPLINDKLYIGLVSDIPEQLAQKIVDSDFYETSDGNKDTFYNYNSKHFEDITAKQSFKTLSNLPYCVITIQNGV